MKQKKMLVLTFSQLKQIYNQEMPELVEMAVKSPTVEDFKAGLLMYLDAFTFLAVVNMLPQL